ncbi:hypothetical protein DSUL_30037 [Desulfovibrionales bacterium]
MLLVDCTSLALRRNEFFFNSFAFDGGIRDQQYGKDHKPDCFLLVGLKMG